MKSKAQKSLSLHLLAKGANYKKDLDYIYIDDQKNVIACNSISALKSNLSDTFGDSCKFDEIFLQYRRIFIHKDEHKKISNKELLRVGIVSKNNNDLYLEFLTKTTNITIKATIEDFNFFDMFFKTDFFAPNKKEIDAIGLDLNQLESFNQAIKPRSSNQPTVFNFTSKTDKILIKNLSLPNTVFILLPVKVHNENYDI